MTSHLEQGGPCENTDRELWREREGDAYADSIHVTQDGSIGINCGGNVYVKPVREWHRLAAAQEKMISGGGSGETPVDVMDKALEFKGRADDAGLLARAIINAKGQK